MFTRRLLLSAVLVLSALMIHVVATPAYATCPFCFPNGSAPAPPASASNINWTFVDSIAGCPAGDSLILVGHSSLHPHPSKLRMEVWYNDNNCNPKPKVPPDSIWVTWSTLSGNVVANDLAAKTFADDSTDQLCGHTWVTFPSFSGCGTLQANLFVSGVAQGSHTVVIRTVDTNADGRVNSADASGACDVNYDGSANGIDDIHLVQQHLNEGHRNVLHGTPVSRTNLGPFVKGSGFIAWEQPTGDSLAFSAFLGANGNGCVIEVVPSDPKDGSTMTQFTFPPGNPALHDYNPSWSPRQLEISFDRGDIYLYRKGVFLPPLNTDTSETLVYTAPSGNDLTEASFSPNGRTLAFSLVNQNTLSANLYTVSDTGGTATQITSGTSVHDGLPSWSPDGRWIYFARQNLPGTVFSLYKVRDTGDSVTVVFDTLASSGRNATSPNASTDGNVLVAAVDSAQAGRAFTNTLDATLGKNPPAIAAYTGFPSGGLYSRMSPDGTRLAFVAPRPGGDLNANQVWAVRRNMNSPPDQATIGDRSVRQGQLLSFTVSASDPEGDPITYSAYFLRTDLGMSFTNHTFSWTPPRGTAGNSYWVRFQSTTPSGGSDYEVVEISVVAPGGPNGPLAGETEVSHTGEAGLANPSSQVFSVATRHIEGAEAQLWVYSIAGRRVAEIRGPAGARLAWDGRGPDGFKQPAGVYLWRLETGHVVETGKWVLER